MFASRYIRPVGTRAAQCIRRPAPRIATIQPMKAQIWQQRHQSTRSAREAMKILIKKYPFSVPLALSMIAVSAGFLFYANYIYQTYIIGAFHQFPEPVAKQMRKAIFYSTIQVEPKNALKYYREALRVADEIGMDPFSDEIMGIKIALAGFLEKIQQFQKAIGVLEIVKKDNLRWIEELGARPGWEGKRTRLLGKTVEICVKLGDLYSNEYVMEKALAEESLVWAVETTLKEQKRRDEEGVKEGEGEWLTAEQAGGSFEALAHHYEEKDQHYLAAPLFLQALSLCPPTSCHAVVLMNNLSISLAQQDPPYKDGQPTTSRAALVKSARAWAEKAIAVASKIAAPERTDECDSGCAVATHNLGEFEEMSGNVKEALKRFEEAKSLAKAIGFQEGVVNAEQSLKRLNKA